MKKLFLLTAVAFIAGITLSAQEADNAQKQKEKQNREQIQVQNEKQDTHGQAVSQVAKETPSEPGKGQIVSAAAKSKGEAKKARKEKKMKEPKGPKPEKEIKENEYEKGTKNQRETGRANAAGRDAAKGAVRPAGQGKK